MQANKSVRDLIYSKRLRNWEVAKEVGITDTTFSVWLRTELNDERKERVLKAIERLS